MNLSQLNWGGQIYSLLYRVKYYKSEKDKQILNINTYI